MILLYLYNPSYLEYLYLIKDRPEHESFLFMVRNHNQFIIDFQFVNQNYNFFSIDFQFVN
jgi:hypothetical protein